MQNQPNLVARLNENNSLEKETQRQEEASNGEWHYFL
jgi:hypothetical protein